MAIAGLDKRVAALEGTGSAAALAAIDKRLDALQAAKADDASGIAASVKAAQALSGEVKDLRADVDAARGEIPGLSARVAKLESGPPQAPAADLSGVTSRLDKIEAQLSAPKSESRVAPEKPTASDNPAAVAIVADALRDKLARGAPFPTEFGGLERLGVEPAKLAPLKAVVDGAPTDGALAAAFERVRSKVLARGRAIGGAERGRRSLSRPSARSRSSARPERDGGRRSAGARVPHRGGLPAWRRRAARSPPSPGFPRRRARRPGHGPPPPNRGWRPIRPFSRSARRRSRSWRRPASPDRVARPGLAGRTFVHAER